MSRGKSILLVCWGLRRKIIDVGMSSIVFQYSDVYARDCGTGIANVQHGIHVVCKPLYERHVERLVIISSYYSIFRLFSIILNSEVSFAILSVCFIINIVLSLDMKEIILTYCFSPKNKKLRSDLIALISL